jgi:hypothetical protein
MKPKVIFNLVLDAEDAENIFQSIRSSIANTHLQLMQAIVDSDANSVAFLKRDIEYLSDLLTKVQAGCTIINHET